MASLEFIYGEVSVFHAHMKGLAKMVELRGGIDALGLGGMLGELVMWIDSKFYGNDCFLTGISTPPNHQVRMVSRRIAEAGSGPAQLRLMSPLGLLSHLTRHRQLLTRGPKRPRFPARNTKSVPTVLSQPVPIPCPYLCSPEIELTLPAQTGASRKMAHKRP
jgi:hypothetical protein